MEAARFLLAEQCNPGLILELAELNKRNVHVDWAEIYLVLNDLLSKDQRHWDYNCGLFNRALVWLMSGRFKKQLESKVE